MSNTENAPMLEWCPACEAPVEECREAAEIRRRVAELEGRVDD